MSKQYWLSCTDNTENLLVYTLDIKDTFFVNKGLPDTFLETNETSKIWAHTAESPSQSHAYSCVYFLKMCYNCEMVLFGMCKW